MVFTLGRDLAAALTDLASKHGICPEALAIKILRERLLTPNLRIQSRDERERGLLAAASDCGVSLSNEAVSSEGLYQ